MKRFVILLISLMVLMLPSMVFASGGQEGGKPAFGIILPTKDEERWTQDQTRFQDALKKGGYNAQILFSEKDSAKEKANVEALISQGVKAIILCPVDGSAAAAAARCANRAAGWSSWGAAWCIRTSCGSAASIPRNGTASPSASA